MFYICIGELYINKVMRILILDCTGNDWTDRNLSKLENVEVEAVYKQMPLFVRIIRRVHFLINFPMKSFWYGDWKYKILDYDCIIVFSALFGNEIFSWIRKAGYTGKIILYYRDPQSACYLSKSIKADVMTGDQSAVELWTFDKNDAQNYFMKYNPQFYFDAPETDVSPKYDAVYIGASRGRYESIINCYEGLKRQGLNVRFYVKTDKPRVKNDEIVYIKDNIEYEEILQLNKYAKAIVEINQFGQNGLTVRALEALFMRKKLITNNLNVENEKFYNPNNIFILGKDNINTIYEWVNTPFRNVPTDIIEYYKAESWLKRFGGVEKI